MVIRQWNRSDEAKSGYVNDLFSALAKRYDAMTDV
jgi:demethylmenaquinone methyltransferase/2-methoxy-6-polyprenyl-1,4-benzoquinol methylase